MHIGPSHLCPYAPHNPTSSPAYAPDLQFGVVDEWCLYNAKSKNQKKQQFTIPSQFQKKSNIKEAVKW